MEGSRPEELATQLQQWAKKEMQIYSKSAGREAHIPTLEEFKLLCRGSNASVWKWVIANIHSAETVRTVKGNLKLSKSQSAQPSYKVKFGSAEKFDEEKRELLNKRAALSREVTATLRDIGHLDHDIERVCHDLQETEHKYQKQTSSFGDMRRKTALVHAYSHHCQETSAQYQEYIRCISERVQQITTRANKSKEPEEFYSREMGHNLDQTASDSSSLETACVKNVRTCCEAIGSFLQETLKGTFGTNKTEFDRRKEPIWRDLEEVSSRFSAEQILHALISTTHDTTMYLRDTTGRVDIRRDAQTLRFKYDPVGGMTDLASQPNLLRSVHQLLEERTVEHLKRFLEMQRCENACRNLEQTRQSIRAKIDKRLHDVYTKKPAELHAVKTLVDTEIELEGYRAALHCLTAETDRLTIIVEKSLQEKQDLMTKHHKIQDFRNLTEKKQNLIQVLVKQNINAQSRLDAQIGEIGQFVQRSLQSHKSETETLSSRLRDSVTTEIQQFATLSLPYLMFSSVDSALKSTVMDLSINQMSPASIKPALSLILQYLDFPSFQASEVLLKQCMTIKSEIEEAQNQLSREEKARQLIDQAHGERNIAEVISELCSDMRRQDAERLQKSLPLMNHKVNKSASALADCFRAKDTVKHWWEQPGQSCVPWITIDGHNLQYYMDKWTILATNLRRLLVQ